MTDRTPATEAHAAETREWVSVPTIAEIRRRHEACEGDAQFPDLPSRKEDPKGIIGATLLRTMHEDRGALLQMLAFAPPATSESGNALKLIEDQFREIKRMASDELALEDFETCADTGLEAIAALRAQPATQGVDQRDARRYRRLQILGCAPMGSQYLERGEVIRFSGLDKFLDEDIAAYPSRGEASAPIPQTGTDREAVRSARQDRIAKWCADAFGYDHALDVEQRGLRLAEEAIEAAQAANCNPDTLHKLVDYIYAKEPGNMAQELGGVGLCLLAMANACEIDADQAEQDEVARVLSKPLEFFAARNKVKNDAGFVSGAYRQPTALKSPPSPEDEAR